MAGRPRKRRPKRLRYGKRTPVAFLTEAVWSPKITPEIRAEIEQTGTHELIDGHELLRGDALLAKALFLRGMSIQGISAITGLTEDNLNYRAYTKSDKRLNWKQERDACMQAVTKAFQKNHLPVLEDIMESGLWCIKEALESAKKRHLSPIEEGGRPIDLSEAKDIASVISKLDHIKRLTKGEATAHIKTQSITPEEVISVIVQDPMMQHVERVGYESNEVVEAEELENAEYRALEPNTVITEPASAK
jgi:hypothetical protein